MNLELDKFTVKSADRINLKDVQTDFDAGIDKKSAKELLKKNVDELSDLQNLLFADDRLSLLVVLQAPDAAGKDSAIKNVFSGVNPQGVKVTSFKSPSKTELSHDYLWRHVIALPEKGMIEIFNRSHYENIIVTRVHPEYIIGKVPGAESLEKINEDFWKTRFEQINNFEKHISQNGTHILKIYLHLSLDEQKNRFLARIDTPEKNWKFNSDDLKERKLWTKYQTAFEAMINNTSTDDAPWFVIPADKKYFVRLAVSQIIINKLKSMNLFYPTGETPEQLQVAKQLLLNE
jgi:PPK2 family polyphosphate:nucleotide phosphotransferase